MRGDGQHRLAFLEGFARGVSERIDMLDARIKRLEVTASPPAPEKTTSEAPAEWIDHTSNLAAFVKMIAAYPKSRDKWIAKAKDYLVQHGLAGSILRDEPAPPLVASVPACRAAFYAACSDPDMPTKADRDAGIEAVRALCGASVPSATVEDAKRVFREAWANGTGPSIRDDEDRGVEAVYALLSRPAETGTGRKP